MSKGIVEALSDKKLFLDNKAVSLYYIFNHYRILYLFSRSSKQVQYQICAHIILFCTGYLIDMQSATFFTFCDYTHV